MKRTTHYRCRGMRPWRSVSACLRWAVSGDDVHIAAAHIDLAPTFNAREGSDWNAAWEGAQVGLVGRGRPEAWLRKPDGLRTRA